MFQLLQGSRRDYYLQPLLPPPTSQSCGLPSTKNCAPGTPIDRLLFCSPPQFSPPLPSLATLVSPHTNTIYFLLRQFRTRVVPQSVGHDNPVKGLPPTYTHPLSGNRGTLCTFFPSQNCFAPKRRSSITLYLSFFPPFPLSYFQGEPFFPERLQNRLQRFDKFVVVG